MYPFLRLAREWSLARAAGPLPLEETHVSRHRCWPWDLDPWAELNNGRTLTLYDLGRVPLVGRLGVVAALRRNGWGLTVAGASIRYRRRVRMLRRIEMRSRLIGRDARFLYAHQAMLIEDHAASGVLLRLAVTGSDGIVPPEALLAAMGRPDWRPDLPDWVCAWIEAEAARPWPPDI